MSMSINDDNKLRQLKESWARMDEEQMGGTEDKHGHENVEDQKSVTQTGDETNSEANPSADQHAAYSKTVRNGPRHT